jgi:UDP-N-acetylglucosamine acyltransferase
MVNKFHNDMDLGREIRKFYNLKGIHPTAVIGENVTIQEDVYIGPFCIIGFPAEWKGMEDKDCGVIIRKGTRITGHVTIDSGATRRTEIGEGCYLMKHSHVGHDARLEDGVTLSCGAKVGGHTIIGKGCNIGLNAVIHQKQTIAEGCMIGMGAVITKKTITSPCMKYVGNPAKCIGQNIKP